jgi:hypothetical protein
MHQADVAEASLRQSKQRLTISHPSGVGGSALEVPGSLSELSFTLPIARPPANSSFGNIEGSLEWKYLKELSILGLSVSSQQATTVALEKYFQTIIDQLGEPVIDGMGHPAEPVLGEMISAYSASALEKVTAFIFGKRTTQGADLLRLLSRMMPGATAWRFEIVRRALATPHVELRDAAIVAIESWADRQAIVLLKSHRESEKWLAAYAAQVLRDLEGQYADVPR